MNELNLNVDSKTLEACLKPVENLGSTAYHNICTGETVTIVWGFGGWIELLFILLLVTIIVVFGAFIIKIILES